MDRETSDLPTSSRPPPAGQDSADLVGESVQFSDGKSTDFKRMENSSNGTPRRCRPTLPSDFTSSNHVTHSMKFTDEIRAPLGFEPEGSVAAQPFYEKWRLDLNYLLEDSEGRRVFRDFLSREGHEILFDCWLACQDFKSLIPTSSRVCEFAKEFYKKFIAYGDPRIPIRDQTRNSIAQCWDKCFRTHSICTNMYDEMELDVLAVLKNPWFERFISSDFFQLRFSEGGVDNAKKLSHYDVQKHEKHFTMPSVSEECSVDSYRSTQTCVRTNNINQNEMSWQSNRQSQNGVTDEAVSSLNSQGRISQTVAGLSPYRFATGVPATSKNDSEMQSLSSDAITVCDRISTTDSMATDLSDPTKSRREQHHRSRDHYGPRDHLPTLPHFKPRTQRMNKGMKPMKPEEFAHILTEKLEKVLRDREQAEQDEAAIAVGLQFSSIEQNVQTLDSGNTLQHQHAGSGSRQTIPITKTDKDINPLDPTKSCITYSCSDRYSVAGKSSACGSEPVGSVENQLKYKRAKELVSTVHHALRTELHECRCPQCYEAQAQIVHHYHKSYNVHESMAEYSNCMQQTNHCSCCRHLQETSMHHPMPLMEMNGKLTATNLEQLQPSPIIDHSRILSWMQHNEKYQNEHYQPLPSPALHRRQKEPVAYNTTRPSGSSYSHISGIQQPIASDPKMPPLPQPDSNTVLEEVKRRLEDGKDKSYKDRSSKSRHGHSRSSRSHQSQQMFMDPAFTGERDLSTTSGRQCPSGHWSLSDTASSLSTNRVPSLASSSIPSSASRIWLESKSDLHSHSDIRSQSDAPTQSTRSHGSGSSKGRTTDGTVVTYFFGLEPIPYRTKLKGKNLTLGDFKALLSKKGNFRYFFKTSSEDVEVVYEELFDDKEQLPLYQNKVVGKIDKVE